MFRNFLKSAFRNLVRNKFQSIIQILSLSIGLTVFTMVALYLYDEFTVDSSNPDRDRIYRIEALNSHTNPAIFPYAVVPELRSHIPEIEHVTLVDGQGTPPITALHEDGESGTQLRGYATGIDTSFFNVFPQEFLHGDPGTALTDPNSIVLTEGMAKQLFGEDNPMGKTVYVWTRARTVTAVIRDPANTHLKFDWLFPMTRYEELDMNIWWVNRPAYVKLHYGTKLHEVERKIQEQWERLIKDYIPDFIPEMSLCPLKEVYFSDIPPRQSYMYTAAKRVLVNFLLLGLAILLIGIVNYINLTTARASLRIRETALRKIAGSTRGKLVLYFLTESVLSTFLSFLVAGTILQLAFPRFRHMLDADINLYFLKDPVAWVIALLAILIIGIFSGIFPALQMSDVSPVMTVTTRPGRSSGGVLTRRALMAFQFTLAIILMIGIMSMQLQIRYMKEQDPGFEMNEIVWTYAGSGDQFHQWLLSMVDRIPEVELSCLSEGVPGKYKTDDAVVNNPASLLHGMNADRWVVTVDFFRVYGIPLTHGSQILDRHILDWRTGDTTYNIRKDMEIHYVVINETCRKALELDDPLGVMLDDKLLIAGVCEDFHASSLQHPIKPMYFLLSQGTYGFDLSMKIKKGSVDKVARLMEEYLYERDHPGESLQGIPLIPIDLHFMDESYNEQYRQVDSIYEASVYIFLLAMIIACLGLLGLSTFMVQRRVKEIGIRKAMGSSELEVFILLALDFLKWVGLSVLIGCPAGWLVMRTWQKQFAYKADLGIWIYLIAALIALVIALLTVARQSLKTAHANPVESLRYE